MKNLAGTKRAYPDIVFLYTDQNAHAVHKHVNQVRVQEGVTKIKMRAFQGCEDLKNITIPSSVQSIGEYAFDGCASLNSVALPRSLIAIGENAFQGCKSLTSMTLPQSITSIADFTFYDCYSLTLVNLPQNLTTIGEYAFGFAPLNSITLPQNLITIEDAAFGDCESLTSMTFPQNLINIGEHAFHGCSSLESVTFSKGINFIGDYAFNGDGNSLLKSVVIPVHTKICESTFDEHTQVIYTNWFVLGQYLMMRELVTNGRAVPLGEVDDADLQILQHFIVHECDDVLRTVLEMAKEEPPEIIAFEESDDYY